MTCEQLFQLSFPVAVRLLLLHLAWKSHGLKRLQNLGSGPAPGTVSIAKFTHHWVVESRLEMLTWSTSLSWQCNGVTTSGSVGHTVRPSHGTGVTQRNDPCWLHDRDDFYCHIQLERLLCHAELDLLAIAKFLLAPLWSKVSGWHGMVW